MRSVRQVRGVRGFSLVEALVTALIVSGAIAGLAQLVTVGARQAVSARRAASAAYLAQSKIEELRALTFTYAADGSPITDAALGFSPAAALMQDAPGFVDALDRFGAPVAAGAAAHYRRRWAILPLVAGNPDALVLEACVFGVESTQTAEVCTWTIRVRRP